MNKEKVYNQLKTLLRREEKIEVISFSESDEEETGVEILDSLVSMDEPMKNHTSFKVGGPADIFVDPGSEERLIKTIKYLSDNNVPYVIMGNGSNIVFRDGGYRGVVITTNSNLDGMSMSDIGYDQNDPATFTAGAGILLSTLSKIVGLDDKNPLTGMEFASGIPGTLGGALFMNAGAYGGEMKDIVQSARVYNTDTNDIENIRVDEMDLGYRSSSFQNGKKIILDVTISLKKGDIKDISQTMRELMKKRNTKQPVNMPSAGSFFKRPEGYYAGKLVEDTGLKGLTIGGAQISELHAGFMVNKGSATCKDIEDLMQEVKEKVNNKFGVMLEPEVRFLGES